MKLVSLLGNLQVFSSQHVGTPVHPVPPRQVEQYRGPYQARKLRRWHARHPPYTKANGTMIIHNQEGFVLCHPDDLPALEAALREVWKAGRPFV